MKKSARSIFVILIVGLVPQTAFSWGNFGHQTIAEIAERNLSASAKQGVLDILGPEKLALASTWADEVRKDADFKIFSAYHLANVADGATWSTRPASERDERDAVLLVKKYPDFIRDPKISRSVKLVALRYLIHVVGDIHQPLHVGNRHDVGGNICFVKWDGGSETDLHSIWDSKILEYSFAQIPDRPKFRDYPVFADALLKKLSLNKTEIAKIQKATPLEWVQESQDARPLVYPDEAGVAIRAETRAYCGDTIEPLRKADKTEIPSLSDAYKKTASEFAEKRVVYAGLRLAALLNETFSGAVSPGPNTSESKSEILKILSIKNP